MRLLSCGKESNDTLMRVGECGLCALLCLADQHPKLKGYGSSHREDAHHHRDQQDPELSIGHTHR